MVRLDRKAIEAMRDYHLRKAELLTEYLKPEKTNGEPAPEEGELGRSQLFIATDEVVKYLKKHGPTEEKKLRQLIIDSGWVKKGKRDPHGIGSAGRVITKGSKTYFPCKGGKIHYVPGFRPEPEE
jgi:hypothetical protein